MTLALVLAIPFGVALLLAIPLHAFQPRLLVTICNSAIAVQVGLAASAFLVLGTLPRDEFAYGGRDCPEVGGLGGDVLEVVVYSSLAVGAVALASAVLSVRASAAKPGRVLAGLGASGLTYPIWFGFFAAAICSMS